MWQRKSKPVTQKRKRTSSPDLRLFGLFFFFLVSGCGWKDTYILTADEGTPLLLSLRVCPLHDYAWQDRLGTGQPVDMKPEEERQALVQDLVHYPADLLILRGIGSSAALDHLKESLEERGDTYQTWYHSGPTPYKGLGFLTASGVTATALDLSPVPYSIGPRRYLPMVGGIQISLSDGRTLLAVNAQLPTSDQSYERRRNEARLLAQQLRPLLTEDALVLVSIQSRENSDSPITRLLTDLPLEWLRPVDDRGDSWVYRDPEGLEYRNDQWLFASPALKELITGQGNILDTPYLRAAGPYRHQRLNVLSIPQPE